MTAETADAEDGEFNQVLSRLDALMKRSQVEPQPARPGLWQVEAADDVPVLTEVYAGIETGHNVAAGPAVASPAIEELLATLRPALRESLARLVSEELRLAEDALVSRLQEAAEELLRQTLQEVRPK